MISENDASKCRLSVLSFGIAIGVAEGLGMCVFAFLAMFFGYGVHFMQILAEVMPGYSPSFIGGMVGALEGFVDGFIFGAIAGFIYNLCVCMPGKNIK